MGFPFPTGWMDVDPYHSLLLTLRHHIRSHTLQPVRPSHFTVKRYANTTSFAPTPLTLGLPARLSRQRLPSDFCTGRSWSRRRRRRQWRQPRPKDELQARQQQRHPAVHQQRALRPASRQAYALSRARKGRFGVHRLQRAHRQRARSLRLFLLEHARPVSRRGRRI